MILSAVADAIGENVSKGTISHSTLRRYRIQNREATAARIKNNVEWLDEPCVIHWDEKRLPDGGRNEFERPQSQSRTPWCHNNW
jgi:hypothetical protein